MQSKRRSSYWAITVLLIALLTILPMRLSLAEAPPSSHKPDDPQPSWIAICVVAAAGLAVSAVYLIARNCAPKYYWLADDDKPPRTWVGTATTKECQINGWRRVGGPYDRPQDAPTNCPPVTNIVTASYSQVINIEVQSSTDGNSWTTVHAERCDPEDFGYFPTNSGAGMFRYKLTP